ncbi:MAG: hypothetical protein LBE80_09270 [Deltaproteobacteria bacterium]|jgi:phenylacetate-coenzyme A ligase PaaK-like adenylate-forming protein|nr:hypothetical protein [Deltaproteobacteria bacterium]
MSPGLFLNPLDALLEQKLTGFGSLREKLALERLTKLAQSLTLAAQESPFYKKLAQKELVWAAQELRQAAQKALSPLLAEKLIQKVLASLPQTSPADLARSPESFLTVSLSQVEGLITVPSSGSRGQSKRIFSTASDLEKIVEFFSHGMLNLLKPDLKGARVALLLSGQRPGSVGDLLSQALERRQVPIEVLGFLPQEPGRLSEYLKRLELFEPSTLVGLPSQLFYLARTVPRPKSLKNLLLSGEPAPDSLIRGLERAWRAEVFVHFGMTEFGLGGAVECPAHGGPHLREADLVFESLDRAGHQQEPTLLGEICLTSLSRQAMPLIRYRTGDLGRLVEAPCPCASILRKLLVWGRLEDLLIPGPGWSAENPYGLGLTDLAQSVYELEPVSTFSAFLSQEPEPLLRLSLGLSGEIPENFLAQAQKALAQLLKNRLPFVVSLEPKAAPPAPGGAKPKLGRDGLVGP